MAQAKITGIRQIPGSAIWNPSNIPAGAEDLGGTILGDSDHIYLIFAEVWIPFDSIILGRTYREMKKSEETFLGMLQSDFDSDMLARVRPEVATTETLTNRPLITGSSYVSGELSDSRTGTLVIRPREFDRHQGVIFYNTFGKIEQNAKVLFEREENWGYPVIFRALPPDDGSKPYRVGYLRDFAS